MNPMLETVQNEAEQDELDVLPEFLRDHDIRLQDMWWKEADNGVLYGAASKRDPTVAIQLTFDNGGITDAKIENPAEVNWNNLTTKHSPDSGVRDRQFD